jgi:hypothetical protein
MIFFSFSNLTILSVLSPFESFSRNTLLNYQDFFALLLASEPTANIIELQAANVASIGGSLSITLNLFDSFALLFGNLTNSPSTAQQTLITQGISKVLSLADSYFSSFLGLANFKTDAVLQSNPNNSRFYQLYNEIQQELATIMADPATALAYFSNSSVINKFTETAILVGKVSIDSQSSKLNYNYNANWFSFFYFKSFTFRNTLKNLLYSELSPISTRDLECVDI